MKKRTIIKFNIAGSGIPSSATVLNAQMKMYYYGTSGSGWVDRWLQAHQILVNWAEAQATSVNRLTGTAWNVAHVGLNDIDAKSSYESTLFFYLVGGQQVYGWKSWDLTSLTQKWVSGTATNYGVVLWATNETTDGKDLRFYSSEAAAPNDVNRPYLEVIYSQQAKTVYFLKDHLGSVRATVQDTVGAPVRGYDDYDPWGFLLAGRSLASSILPTTTRNRFTGKERDDEFGVNWDYFGARYYDAQIGRWMTRDPLADISPSLTPYHYVRNNPLNFLDPDGLREYANGSIHADSLGEGDWFTSDREENTERWKKANAYNLGRGLSGEYATIAQRSAFYQWFSDWSFGAGNEIYWPAAAAIVAGLASNVDDPLAIATMPVTVREFTSEVNVAIFNDVFKDLQAVFMSNDPLVGQSAMLWDVITVYEEQVDIVAPFYNKLSYNELGIISSIASGSVFPFNFYVKPEHRFRGDISSYQDRAMHGLRLLSLLRKQ